MLRSVIFILQLKALGNGLKLTLLAWDLAKMMGRTLGGWTSIKQHELKYSGHNCDRRTDYTTTILGNKVYIIGGKVTVGYQYGEFSDSEDETTGIVNVVDLETWGPHEGMVS